ncbi:hypothetical protein [Rickettsia endosymbiont of Culicoides newsteadi]|uniref:hypothetical protein n=1 Tax=Rickettsia endosymbiont of Culicoides newsteadi TaxID=1961830 RepID=UPI00105590D4|nr:hypothetical protein [Rickettsia endosymbiont of Culicoides newsteadi]
MTLSVIARPHSGRGNPFWVTELLRRLMPPSNDVFIKKVIAMDNVTNFSSIDYRSFTSFLLLVMS